MAIKRRKRGGHVYLEEHKTTRVGKKVVSKFVSYIGREDAQSDSYKPRKKVIDRLDLSRSYRAGDVRLLWSIAEDLGFIRIIDGICCSNSGLNGISPGKLLTIWAINRAIDPDSATMLERWVSTTDLPYLAGLPAEVITKDAFLYALDFVCKEDKTADHIIDLSSRIDDALYQRWRKSHPLPDGEKETLAYDLTTLLFFGVSCPLAELGYNPDRIRRRQANLAVLVSKRDRYPLSHFVYNGSRHSISTVKNLLNRLSGMAIEPGTLIWDRGNVSKKHVQMVDESGWKLICGVPKTSKEAKEIIGKTKIPISPDSLVRSSQAGHIYAIKTENELFGKERSTIVYANRERSVRDADARNEALAVIGESLKELSQTGKDWSEKRLHNRIKNIVGQWSDFIDINVRRKKDGPRFDWCYDRKKLRSAEKYDKKWLILSTNSELDAYNAVNFYLEKDFIEKVFRVLKTQEEVEPVRHRLEHRVKAYLFVCMLAYRLLAVLQWMLKEASGKEGSWESANMFLRDLAMIQRVEVRFGNEVKTWYLNMTDSVSATLKQVGMSALFKEETRIAS
jgi:transposase